MTGFDDRERALEAKFALGEELKFRALARRNRMFAERVAAKLGLHGAALADYVRDALKVAMRSGDANALVEKARVDLAARDVAVSVAELTTEIDALMAEALTQINRGEQR